MKAGNIIGIFEKLYERRCRPTIALRRFALSDSVIKRLQKSRIGPLVRKIVPSFRGHCSFFPSNMVILADGDVTTCCNDFLGKNVLGNTSDISIKDLWRHRIHQIGQKGLYHLEGCQNCLGSALAPYFPEDSSFNQWKAQTRFPLRSLQIELVARCNYDCCSSNEMRHYRKRTKADLEQIYSSIKESLGEIEDIYFFNNGEPLLHEGFCDFTKKCRSLAPNARFHISTNGMLLNEKVARCMIDEQFHNVTISVHGGPGTENMLKYSKYGANYPRILENVRYLTSLRNSCDSKLPTVELKAVLFNWNDTDDLMNSLREDGKRVGVNRVFWVLDWNGPDADRSSKRFLPGSKDLLCLIDRGEFLNYGTS